MGDATAQTNYAWYGKLPGAGDFVSRRMPYRLQQFWDQWCAAGVEQLKETTPASGWAIWRNMPCWAFLMSAQQGIPFGQLGVIAPSCDRVGRMFPMLVVLAIQEADAPTMVRRAANIGVEWAKAIIEAQQSRMGVDAFDAMLNVRLSQCMEASEETMVDSEATLPQGANPSTLPWPDLQHNFDLFGNDSYWWSVPPAQTGFRARTHRGMLTASYFTSLTQ